MTPTPLTPLRAWTHCISLLCAVHGLMQNVSQVPSSLSVMEGEAVNLTCTLESAAKDIKELSFIWNLGNTEQTCPLVANATESSSCDPPDPRVSITAHLPTKSSVLTITQTTRNHSSTYRCQVKILKPLPIVSINGNGSVVWVQGMVDPSHLDWLLPLAAVSTLLMVFLCTFLIYILVRKKNKGQARDKSPGQVIQNRWDPVSDDQDSPGVVYSMVQAPTSGLHQQQSEEGAYAEISLPELGRPPSEWVRTEYAVVHR
ncbi:uncharacterized protein LOC144676126 isoform X3 [Cetorhinus maximus]